MTGALTIAAITQFGAVEVKQWPNITKLGTICSTMSETIFGKSYPEWVVK